MVTGSAVAYYAGFFQFGPALAALLAALLLQIGANIANDVFDFHRGADTHERLGPLRVTQAGLLTPQQALAGMWVTFGLAALLGVYLIIVAGHRAGLNCRCYCLYGRTISPGLLWTGRPGRFYIFWPGCSVRDLLCAGFKRDLVSYLVIVSNGIFDHCNPGGQ